MNGQSVDGLGPDTFSKPPVLDGGNDGIPETDSLTQVENNQRVRFIADNLLYLMVLSFSGVGSNRNQQLVNLSGMDDQREKLERNKRKIERE
jgi:hypothetical protein